MFSQASVILFTGGYVADTHWAETPRQRPHGQTSLDRDPTLDRDSPRQRPSGQRLRQNINRDPPDRDGHKADMRTPGKRPHGHTLPDRDPQTETPWTETP